MLSVSFGQKQKFKYTHPKGNFISGGKLSDENQRKLDSSNQDSQKSEVEGDDELSEYDYQEKPEETEKIEPEKAPEESPEEKSEEKSEEESEDEFVEDIEKEEDEEAEEKEKEEQKEKKQGFFSKIKKRRQERKERKEKEKQEREKAELKKQSSVKKESHEQSSGVPKQSFVTKEKEIKEKSRREKEIKHSKEHRKHSKKEDSDKEEYYTFETDGEEEYYSIKADPKKILIAAVVIIAVVLLVFGIIYFKNKMAADREAAELAEKNMPAKIQLYVISNSQCSNCASIADVIAGLESSYNVTKTNELDFDSAEAKSMVSKYKITKIPSVIIVGELNKTGEISGFTEGENAYILSDIEAPYTDTSSGEIKGRVSMTLIKAPCRECVNLTAAAVQMREMASIVSDVALESSSDEARSLISKYSIKKLPALVMSRDVQAYSFADLLENVGTYETDGAYVLRNVSPPYYDLAQSKIIGLVKVTYISDKTCADCYNVSEHRFILESLGMKFSEEKYIDVSNELFIALKNKYNITKVPTIVLSGEAMEYATLREVWSAVGTEESDGTLIFTQMENMGTYRDLTKGKIINATIPQ